MNRKFKKILAMLLILALVLSQYITVFANGSAGDSTTSKTAKEKILQKIENQMKVNESGLDRKPLIGEEKNRAVGTASITEKKGSTTKISDAVIPLETQSLTKEINVLGEETIIPGKMIVKYKEGLSISSVTSLSAEVSILSVNSVRNLGITELRLSKETDVLDAVETLKKNPDVEYAEPVYKRSALADVSTVDTSNCNDDYYAKGWQWGLQAVNLDDKWTSVKKTPLSDIVIAVIDTGVDTECAELRGNLVDGYDFVNDDDDADDDYGHGTHVAGIIAAAWDGNGIAGVANGAKIMPIKVLDQDGSGDSANVINGILYAVNNGADIINMSLGGYGYSRAEEEAIKYAEDCGVVVVAAAGNEHFEHAAYPAAYDGAICVGAADWNGSQFVMAGFSNYGSEIDIVAPGVNILSTVPRELDNFNNVGDNDPNGYTLMSGTSMATPFVAGMAALILSETRAESDPSDGAVCDSVLTEMQSNGLSFDSDNQYTLISGNNDTIGNQFDYKRLSLNGEIISSREVRLHLFATEIYNSGYSSSITGDFVVYMAQYQYDGGQVDIEDPVEVCTIQLINGEQVSTNNVTVTETGNYLFYAVDSSTYMDSNMIGGSIISSTPEPDVDGDVDFDTAESLVLGQELKRNLTPADQDFYKLEIVEDGAYKIYSTGNTDTYGYLYDSTQLELQSNDDTPYPNFSMEADLTRGIYYLKVQGFSQYCIGNYGIVAEPINTISGTVSLPGPVNSVDMAVLVYPVLIDDTGNEDYIQDSITGTYTHKETVIRAGSNSADYKFIVGVDIPKGVDYKIEYYVPSIRYTDAPYIPLGYFSAGGTVKTIDSAEVISKESSCIADMALLLKASSADEIGSSLITVGQPLQQTMNYAHDVDKFELTIETAGEYIISCGIEDGSTNYIPYITTPYQSTIQFGGSESSVFMSFITHFEPGIYTLTTNDRAYLFNEYQYEFSVNKCSEISGQLSLPAESVNQGYSAEMLAERTDGKFYWGSRTVNPTTVGAPYSLFVPAADGYKVSYYCDNAVDYFVEGYYSENGMVTTIEAASSVDMNNNLSGIDLILLNGSEGSEVNPTPIVVGKHMSGAIGENDEDFYQFTVSDAGNYLMQFGSDNAGLRVYLHDGLGEWVGYGETETPSNGGGGGPAPVPNSLPANSAAAIPDTNISEQRYHTAFTRYLAAGEYDIKIHGSGSAGAYEFVVNAPPVAANVMVSGVAKVGKTLTGSYTLSDADGDETVANLRWFKADSAEGSFTAITGATADTYELAPSDFGKFIKFEVIPISSSAPEIGVAVSSPIVGPIAATVAPVATEVSVSGTAKIGNTLTGSYKFTDGDREDIEATSTFRWLQADSVEGTFTAISGATAKTYALTPSNLGKFIKFEVTPISSSAPEIGEAVSSSIIGPIAATVAPVATEVSVLGTAKVGNTLTGSCKFTDGDREDIEATSTFRWLKADASTGTYTEITGATAKTYVLTTSDLGKFIKFEVTPKSSSDPVTGEVAMSAAVGPVISADTSGGGGGGATAVTAPATILPIVELPNEPVALAGTFADAIGHWAQKNIEKLAALGIIGGYPDGTVHPDGVITRAEAARILIGATGKKESTGEIRQTFSDKDAIPSWAKGYIVTALDTDIMLGFTDNTFKASENLTREQMVTMIMRAYALGQSDTALTFADNDMIGSWSKGYVSKSVELGVVKGYVDNTFRPTQNVTRAEFLTVIAGCLDLKEQ